MNLAMNKERIHNFVLDLCRQNKVECEWHFSENTNSMYYKIYKDDVWLTFRISDHAKKQRSLPSITVSRSTTLQHVGKFVKNRIDCLKGLSSYRLFSEFMRTQDGVISRAGEFHIYHIGGEKYGIAR